MRLKIMNNHYGLWFSRMHLMRRLFAFTVFLILSVGLTYLAVADIYSWTDEDGVKHYSNEPPVEVEDARQEVEHGVDEDLERKSDEVRKRRQEEVLGKVPAGSNEKVTKNPGNVVLYTKSGNRDCNFARGFFDHYSIPYTELDVDKDEEAKDIAEQYKGRLPIIVVGRRIYRFFDVETFYRIFGIPLSDYRGHW